MFTHLIGIIVGVGDGVLALGGAIPTAAADTGDPPLQRLHDGNSFHLFLHLSISFLPRFSLSTIESSSPSFNTFAALNNFHPFSSSPQFSKWGLLSAATCIHRLFHSLSRAEPLLSLTLLSSLNGNHTLPSILPPGFADHPSRKFTFIAMTGSSLH